MWQAARPVVFVVFFGWRVAGGAWRVAGSWSRWRVAGGGELVG